MSPLEEEMPDLFFAGCYSIALLSYISVRVVREYKKPKAVEEAEEHAGARFMLQIFYIRNHVRLFTKNLDRYFIHYHLVGALEHFLLIIIYGIILPID
jgi:hypothetical protein